MACSWPLRIGPTNHRQVCATHEIYFFWGQEQTDLKVKRDYICIRVAVPGEVLAVLHPEISDSSKIVDEASAEPVLDNTQRSGIPASNSQMRKFEDTRSMAYRTIVSALMRYERVAPAIIAGRWIQETEMLRTLWRNEAKELMKDDQETAVLG